MGKMRYAGVHSAIQDAVKARNTLSELVHTNYTNH